MIRFVCKKCGTLHERSEGEAGTLVFCDCGQSNRVPWESSPEKESSRTLEEGPAIPAVLLEDDEPEPWLERPRPSRRSPERPTFDRACCLNHQDTPSQQTCADCGDGFCDRCLVILQRATLCAPCKNLRLRNLHRSRRISVLAIVALVLALASGPLAFCFLGLAAGSDAFGFAVAGFLPSLIALALAIAAVREIERNPQVGGRALAVTGLVVAIAGTVVMGLMLVMVRGRFSE